MHRLNHIFEAIVCVGSFYFLFLCCFVQLRFVCVSCIYLFIYLVHWLDHEKADSVDGWMNVNSHAAGEQQRGTTDPGNNQFPHHRRSRPARERKKKRGKIQFGYFISKTSEITDINQPPVFSIFSLHLDINMVLNKPKICPPWALKPDKDTWNILKKHNDKARP